MCEREDPEARVRRKDPHEGGGEKKDLKAGGRAGRADDHAGQLSAADIWCHGHPVNRDDPVPFLCVCVCVSE